MKQPSGRLDLWIYHPTPETLESSWIEGGLVCLQYIRYSPHGDAFVIDGMTSGMKALHAHGFRWYGGVATVDDVLTPNWHSTVRIELKTLSHIGENGYPTPDQIDTGVHPYHKVPKRNPTNDTGLPWDGDVPLMQNGHEHYGGPVMLGPGVDGGSDIIHELPNSFKLDEATFFLQGDTNVPLHFVVGEMVLKEGGDVKKDDPSMASMKFLLCRLQGIQVVPEKETVVSTLD